MEDSLLATGAALPEVAVNPDEIVVSEVLSGTELAEQRKRTIETIRQKAELTVKESNLDNVAKLNDALTAGIDRIGRAVELGALDSIENGKQMGEAVKALQTLKEMRDDMLDRCIDDGGQNRGKRGMKVSVEFSNQGVSVGVSGT